MIIDRLENAERYFQIHKNFKPAFDFLRNTDLKSLELGRYEIDGDKVFAMVAKDQGGSKDDGLLEVHNRYIDIQLVLDGVDEMGWRSRSECRLNLEPYNDEKDVQFFEDRPETWTATHPGEFTVFFPEDAHLPLISDGKLHKVVVKVQV